MESAHESNKDKRTIENKHGEGEKHELSWHSVYSTTLHHDGNGSPKLCKNPNGETVLSVHSASLPDCQSTLHKDKEVPLLPVLKLETSETTNKFVLDSAQEDSAENKSSLLAPENEAKYGLKGTYEHESARSYLHASIVRKQGGVDEVFADDHLTSPIAYKAKAEPDVWTVGAISAGHERKLFSNENTSVWLGLGATVNPVFDRELREKTSAAPVTVYTNFRINY
jgi:hypothetical protein